MSTSPSNALRRSSSDQNRGLTTYSGESGSWHVRTPNIPTDAASRSASPTCLPASLCACKAGHSWRPVFCQESSGFSRWHICSCSSSSLLQACQHFKGTKMPPCCKMHPHTSCWLEATNRTLRRSSDSSTCSWERDAAGAACRNCKVETTENLMYLVHMLIFDEQLWPTKPATIFPMQYTCSCLIPLAGHQTQTAMPMPHTFSMLFRPANRSLRRMSNRRCCSCMACSWHCATFLDIGSVMRMSFCIFPCFTIQTYCDLKRS